MSTTTYTASSWTSNVWRVYATVTTEVQDKYVSINLDAGGIDVKASQVPSNSMTFTLTSAEMSAEYVFPAQKRPGGSKGTKYPAPSFSGTTYIEVPRSNEDRTVTLTAKLLNTSGATSTVSFSVNIPAAEVVGFTVHYSSMRSEEEYIDIVDAGQPIALRGETYPDTGRLTQVGWEDSRRRSYSFGQTVSGGAGETLYLYATWGNKPYVQTEIDRQNNRTLLRKRFDIEIEFNWVDDDGEHSVLFDESRIISATVSLRGLEDTLDNPSLQASEIEAKIVTDIAFEELEINESNSSIRYRAGYREANDWCEWRTFYGASRITREGQAVDIRGIDTIAMLDNLATRSEVYSASKCRDAHPGDKWKAYIQSKLDEAGIQYQASLDPEGTEVNSLINSFGSLRELIAALMNATNHEGVSADVVIYNDAGSPELIVGGTYDDYLDDIYPRQLMHCTKPEKVIDDRVLSIGFSHFDVNVASATETIKSQSVKINTIYEDNAAEGKYYRDITTSRGTTITSDAQSITYKADSSGTNTTKGYLAELSDFSEFRLGSACFCGSSIWLTESDCQITLPAIYGTLGFSIEGGGPLAPIIDASQNVTYKFNYRGDPRLKPNTPVMLDGEEYIIKSITTVHENGGTIQEVIAKKRYKGIW